MLQWGPESERCYRTKRLEFQGPANKRQSSPFRKKGERGDGGVQRGGNIRVAWSVCICNIHTWKKYMKQQKNILFCSSRFLPFSLFMSWSCGKKASKLICQLCTYMHAACLYRKMANTGAELMEQNWTNPGCSGWAEGGQGWFKRRVSGMMIPIGDFHFIDCLLFLLPTPPPATDTTLPPSPSCSLSPPAPPCFRSLSLGAGMYKVTQSSQLSWKEWPHE